VSDKIHEWLDIDLVVTGVESNIWDLWQGMSLMMGLLLIVIGLMSVAVIVNLRKGEYPPLNISVIIILMLLAVVYSGVNYFGEAQVYGGITGILIQTTSIILSKK